MRSHWLDRATSHIAPVWTLKRQRARIAGELLARHYEGASPGRRTQGWRRVGGDANAVIGPALSVLRTQARDLVRNNPYAESALSTIVDHAVGTGIVARATPRNKEAQRVGDAWALTTDCDADGRHDIYGLEKLVKRTVVESGECLVRRRIRRPADGFALPMQLQILDPDFLDTSKDTSTLGTGTSGLIIQGVEYDAIGRRIAYWLFPEHPGSSGRGARASERVPAESLRHVFRPLRPGQVRGPSWFAPVLLRFRDFDEMEDATLMKQKIAACLAVFITDPDGTNEALGSTTAVSPQIDALEPGLIKSLPPGAKIETLTPPTTREYGDYAKNVLRAIATGLGVTYEDLTGDYQDMPFSAARMSRLRHWARVEDWRWRILVPQFCDPVWAWAMEVAVVAGLLDTPSDVEWTAPPLPMIDPVNEGLAYMRNRRAGLQTLGEQLRERGSDPQQVLEELAAENTQLDDLGLVLDSDPRKMTQAGQLQGTAAAATPASDPAPSDPAVRHALALTPRR